MARSSRAPGPAPPGSPLAAYWASEPEALLAALRSARAGLSGEEARRRAASRPGQGGSGRFAWIGLLWRQLTSPIVLLLLGAAGLSYALEERTDAVIIVGIVAVSSLLGFAQEHRAGAAVQALLRLVQTRVRVLRGGRPEEVLVDQVVAGDVAVLEAGASIPGDGVLLEARDLHVDESTLTGETFPAEKAPGTSPVDAPLGARPGALFAGTHVVSGVGRMLVVATGASTEFGRIAAHLRLRAPETDFERGIRRFGRLLLELTFLLTLGVFAANVFFARPALDSFLFALALAVGLTPQLLPAVIAVNLARGARVMARADVIVKRLAAIESFGSMSVLCSDKTGTLTEGTMALRESVDAEGAPAPAALAAARINAALQQGYQNPIDEALLRGAPPPGARRLDEIPYDFVRKRLSVLVEEGGQARLITKGAVEGVLGVCVEARLVDGRALPRAELAAAVHAIAARAAGQGLRVLAVAERILPGRAGPVDAESEREMTFLGLLMMEDPLRADAAETIAELGRLGVRLKMITGDHALLAAEVARRAGLRADRVITGAALRRMSETALLASARDAEVFAEVEPDQKERIVRALRKSGHVVGYVGDGINDAPALHAADVGISVSSAADVAREAADFVLLKPGLRVLHRGILEGRRVFANTMKYVFMAASANFGNMFSMAGASLLLPFLPLLPKQILLLNVLTDLPEMTIAGDRVDPEWLARPEAWDTRFIRRFMIAFGALSSVFDFLTFAVLLRGFGASSALFRTGWFVESVISASAIVLVIRTRGPITRSAPSPALGLATLGVAAATLALPFTSVAPALGLVPLPLPVLGAMLGIVVAYGVSAELVKRAFYRVAGVPAAAPARERLFK